MEDERKPLVAPVASVSAPIAVNTAPSAAGSTNRSYYAQGKGLGLITTVFFVIGEMAGGGILSLPYGIMQMGWIGSVVIVAVAVVSGYTGVLLGRCWEFLLLQWPSEYAQEHVRHPYPAIGERASGRWANIAVAVLIDITLFCVSTVFILIVSENFQCLFAFHGHELNYRAWIAIVGVILIPLNWLESPKDSWWIAAIATIATSVAVVIVIVILLVNGRDETAVEFDVTFQSFCLGFAIVAFAFGGHASFPTYQHDMADTSKFGLAVMIGYTIILCMYVPVSAIGSEFMKNNTAGNVLSSLSSDSHSVQHATTAVTWLFSIHVLFGYVIVANPVSQDLERMFRVPQKFGFGRIIVRTIQVILSACVAIGVPCFPMILSLIGGTTVMLLSYIFPSLFFLQLAQKLGHYVAFHEVVVNYIIIALSIITMCATCYSAIYAFITSSCKFPVVKCST